MVFHLLFVEGCDQQKKYRKKKIWISSLRKPNCRICHQNCGSPLASDAVLSKNTSLHQAPWTSFSWVTPASRQYFPIISIHPPQHFLLRILTSPYLGKLLSSSRPFTPVYLLPFDLVVSLVHPWSAFPLGHGDTPASSWLSPVPAHNLCRNFMCRSP